MKAILEFDLDDPFDRDSHRKAVNGDKYGIALSDLKNLFRKVRKYDYKIGVGREVELPLGTHVITVEESNLLYQVMDELEDEFYEIINDLGLNED